VTAGPAPDGEDWTRICAVDELPVERGVTALVRGQAVAVFRTHDDRLFALSNHDPFSRASVLARGIVGTRGEVPFVGSPMHKQAFDLRSGVCLDEPSVSVARYAVRLVGGFVEVGPRSSP
jgi:nitrite reductase (NADH) small subunit